MDHVPVRKLETLLTDETVVQEPLKSRDDCGVLVVGESSERGELTGVRGSGGALQKPIAVLRFGGNEHQREFGRGKFVRQRPIRVPASVDRCAPFDSLASAVRGNARTRLDPRVDA
jgi:hypothetical protein